MLATALASLLLLAAPDDDEAAKKLRIAWASQYEWREDGVKDATLDFTWKQTTRTRRDEVWSNSGTGQLVVVGNEIKRQHVEGVSPGGVKEVREGLEWTVRRYVRKPFEEEFKDVQVKALKPTLAGADRIEAGDMRYLLKNERIIAVERRRGTAKKPIWDRVDYKLEGMGDGYARVRESSSWTTDKNEKLTVLAVLKQRAGAPIPVPESYTQLTELPGGGRIELTIAFGEPRINSEHAILIDPKAAELVKAAWNNRYVLPSEVRITADFERKPDKALARSNWPTIEGELQVWGMDSIEAEVSEKSIRSRSFRATITKTCLAHIRWMFGLIKDTPFDQAFKDCGFRITQDGEKQVVRVYGWPEAVALLIEDGNITGYLENFGPADSWTYLKLKEANGGRMLVERLTRTYEGEKLTAKISYRRTKGLLVPKKFQKLVTYGAVFGVAEYNFRKLKVTLPKD